MIHTFVGSLGHLLVVTAFVFAVVAAISYWKASQNKLVATDHKEWLKLGRISFAIQGVAVLGVIASLFFIIYNHYYEYHYAWSHSSNNLPVHFMISCFWEGQEGSFLLWIFWHVLIGAVLILKSKQWETSVMTVFALVQAFLLSMILGISLFELKIGSSPFILLRDAIEAPVFEMNPDYVPEDGTGLNPLLQNYWMVIHPPTLFLGFALVLAPFAFAIAGLWKRDYRQWIKPALPWAHTAAGVLGVGIMMGAYWAYETLNFGGYWNWDPVENAVYIPWLVLVAAIHLMMVVRKNQAALKAAFSLIISSFLLILYATFLTRSGVLGEASVHSFTDLGLSGQLLIYLMAFLVLSGALLVNRWKELPGSKQEVSFYSREFWIFTGATILTLAAFQVLVPTSIPVYNSFLGFFGITSNAAPPADQVAFYTKFQLWFGVAIALGTATAQYFWWQNMESKKLSAVFTLPVALTLVFSAVIISAAQVQDPIFIVLLTASIYALVANLHTVLRIGTRNLKLAGGSLAHTGVALMLVGVMFSSGYSNVISLNMSGRPWHKDFSEEMNRENLLLFRNEPRQMREYQLDYRGPRVESDDIPFYIDKEILFPTNSPHHYVLKESVLHAGEVYAQKGDTIQVYNENTYYEVAYTNQAGEVFTLYPRIQDNPQMGAVPSPDIRQGVTADLYTHITNIAVDDEETEWSQPEEYVMQAGDTAIMHDFIVILDGVSRQEEVVGVDLNTGDVAVKAHLRVLGKEVSHEVEPIFLIKDQQAGMIPSVHRDLGMRVTLDKISPESGSFTFKVQTTQKDWIILKAIEKPYINLLWLGTIMIALGFGVAIFRRYKESITASTGSEEIKASNKSKRNHQRPSKAMV